MPERPAQLQSILNAVRRRWLWRSRLAAAALGCAAAAAVVLAGWGATFVAREGAALVVVAAVVLAAAAFALTRAWWSVRHRPHDRQIARLIEERDGGLDDVLATAVEYSERPDASPRMREALFGDASRALTARRLDKSVDHIVSSQSVRRAALAAFAAAGVLVAVGWAFAPSMTRATQLAVAYLFPARINVEVLPGNVKVPAGEPLTIIARVDGGGEGLVPTLNVAVGDQARSVRMTPGVEPGTYEVTIDEVTASFAYNITAAAARSADFAVTMIRPPRVERIDVHYEFPKGLGLEPRIDEDSGDIYAPAGTKVRLSIAADKPIASAFLTLDNGTRVPLSVDAEQLEGAMTIAKDGSYRISLFDQDGLDNCGETEYFIRTINDRPPDVRILRPASDKPVTALEEVVIEARADDDFGVRSLELVVQTPDGKERAIPLGPDGRAAASSTQRIGTHTVFMEDLRVAPGDFVTYYARARDVGRGRRSTESRSDIFFLEVKPFEEEFVAAQSQQMGQGAGMESGIEQLAEIQKQIIVATWNLDARSRRAQGAKPRADIAAIAKSQTDLRELAEEASDRSSRLRDPRARRRIGGGPPPGEDPIGKAVDAMNRAIVELDKASTSDALPHQREALNHLLRAEAENRRRQVTRSQQAGGGGGQNRAEADLSSLFDQELRKRQQTNYESPNSTESRQEQKQENPLDRIRELARRQDALNRQQQELARNRQQMNEEELRRQLERLTREQQALREQAEQLAKQMQQQGGQAGKSGQQGQAERMREISEDMRRAATGLQRQDAGRASQSGSQASERLRDLERQMASASPDERRRALGDLQLETRQLAEAQRRLSAEADKTAEGEAGSDARRRLAAEQERLAGRAERLQENLERLAQGGSQGGNGDPTQEAARELERQRVSERMREGAEALRQGSARKPQQDLARALDRVADQLGAASGTQDADTQRFSEQLARTQELRDKVEALDRSIEQLQREGQRGGRVPDVDGPSQPRQGGQPKPGAEGTPGAGAAGGGERLADLQRQVNEGMREVEKMAESLRREHPGMEGAPDGEQWWRSFSAPGTEAFKQDFSRWESLKKNLLVAIDDVQNQLSGELRARETHQRLNGGGHEAVSEAYRDLVDQYYRSLAAPRRQR